MALHDDYLRRTPWELAFPDPAAADALMDEIAAEAEGRGASVSAPGAFAMLGAVGGFLRELRGPDTPAEAVHEYAALVFHAFHLRRSAGPVLLVDTHVVRYLVEGDAPEGSPSPPASAGYVQLPRHLFWIQPTPDQAAEAVDGFFWTAASGVLHVLLATGMHEGRPGLGVVPLPEAPLDDAPRWLRAHARDGGDDFATTLPGGELEGLYSLVTAGEVLKLASRTFAYLDRFPDASVEGVPGAEGASPEPSALPYRRLILTD